MKINGNLEVSGETRIHLPKIDSAKTIPENDGFLFLDSEGKLCYRYNGKILIVATTQDTDLSRWLGKMINSSGSMNVTEINKIFEGAITVKNTDSLLDILNHIVHYVKNSKEPQCIPDMETLVESNSSAAQSNLIHGDKGVVYKDGEDLKTISLYKELSSPEAKKFHIIKHDLGKRFCWVQVIDPVNHKSVSPTKYEIRFTEDNRFSITLDTESPIIVLVA